MKDIAPVVEKTVQAACEVLQRRRARPAATYRIQFDKEHLTFRDAAQLVPYLHRLGVSHIYASPYLASQSTSSHGYSVVDYSRIDPKYGSSEDYEAFIAALREHGMGHLLDVVPNHMSAASGENAWWTDVLENGPASPYADYFDIDWQPVREDMENRILLPVLENQFGVLLESGELELVYEEGGFGVRYYDRRFPIDPKTYDLILTHDLDTLRGSLQGADESRPAAEDETSPRTDSVDLLEFESIITAIRYLPDRDSTVEEQDEAGEIDRPTDAAPPESTGQAEEETIDETPVEERRREKEIIKRRLSRLVERCPEIARHLGRVVKRFNGTQGVPESFDLLEHLLDAQAWRLSDWRVAADEINYRRFFDVNELAAIRTEDWDVFEDSHRYVFTLLAEGKVDGLRIDHVDGLFDPLEYLWRLQWEYVRAVGRTCYREIVTLTGGKEAAETETGASHPGFENIESQFLQEMRAHVPGPAPLRILAQSRTPGGDSAAPDYPTNHEMGCPRDALPLYVLVEKILGPEEPLPPEWPVAGTTGYDFMSLAAGLFVHPEGERNLERVYRRYTRRNTPFDEEAIACKLLILRVAMSSELQFLARSLGEICMKHRRSRDFTLNTLRTALREILACFPVYRTYVGSNGVCRRDREIIRRAMIEARRRNPAVDARVFDFISKVLLLEEPADLDAPMERLRRFFVGKFQQVTSSVMAKGVEDTAFYRYFPLASANEVGNDPTRAVVSAEDFHQENVRRRNSEPASMLATSTHDNKRSEDVRARISVLSEIPKHWKNAVNHWTRANRRLHRDVDGGIAPSKDDEYLFYQTLVGTWPLQPLEGDEYAGYVERIAGYMAKTTHEAKVHTSWISPNPDYDDAVSAFVRSALEDRPKNRFLSSFVEFHERIVDWGLCTSLAQAFLKLTAPGVPDTYQGQEIWDFSLVDPDNRRPVDFEKRRRRLAHIQNEWSAGEDSRAALVRRLAGSIRGNEAKLFLTWRLLNLRARLAPLFESGEYLPLAATGSRAYHACAFAWLPTENTAPGTPALIAVAPRLIATLCTADGAHQSLPLGNEVWQDTALDLPETLFGQYTDVLTGALHTFDGESPSLGTLLGRLPVALLETS